VRKRIYIGLLVLLAAVVVVIVYRRPKPANVSPPAVMNRVISMKDTVKRTGRISEADLAWSLRLVQSRSSAPPSTQTLIFAIYARANRADKSQRRRMFDATTPFLSNPVSPDFDMANLGAIDAAAANGGEQARPYLTKLAAQSAGLMRQQAEKAIARLNRHGAPPSET
jgi:hypothetical protein